MTLPRRHSLPMSHERVRSLPFAGGTGLHFVVGMGVHEVLQLAVAPRAGVEVGREPRQVAAHCTEVGPAVVTRRDVHGLSEEPVELAVALQRRLRRRCDLGGGGGKVLDVDEGVAGCDEGLGGLPLAEP